MECLLGTAASREDPIDHNLGKSRVVVMMALMTRRLGSSEYKRWQIVELWPLDLVRATASVVGNTSQEFRHSPVRRDLWNCVMAMPGETPDSFFFFHIFCICSQFLTANEFHPKFPHQHPSLC